MAAGDTRKVLLKNKDGEFLVPFTELATANSAGRVKPDGTTTIVDSEGKLSVSVNIPTVNNPTITITQGGVSKGTFTLNQASNQTIALDAGGSEVEAFTAAEVQTIWNGVS